MHHDARHRSSAQSRPGSRGKMSNSRPRSLRVAEECRSFGRCGLAVVCCLAGQERIAAGFGAEFAGAAIGKGAAIRPSRRRAGKNAQNFPTERKYVSILRADLHRSSDLVTGLALEDSIARLAPALEQMRLAVHQHGGIVYREMGDGIFAVFGAPIANDLHAVMGCFAALELLRRIEALGDDSIRVRIGVHSGLVVAGPRQLDYTRMYDFDGPPLIMAERLQAIAELGQALASDECRTLAEGYIRFGSGQTHALKGFAQPIMIYPVQGVEELSKWRVTLERGTAVFVGREAEFSHLLRIGETVAAGKGQSIIVSGEPGVGKSRLAREALGALSQRGWQSIEVECSPIVGHSPFSLLKSILIEAMSTLSAAEVAALKAELPAPQSNAFRIIVDDAAADTLPDWTKLAPRSRGRAIACYSACSRLPA